LADKDIKRRVKPVSVWFFVMCILAEVASNRPLHHLLLSYGKMGQAGHEYVINNLTWDHVAERVLSVIESQCAGCREE
jgi:hypothetical protein